MERLRECRGDALIAKIASLFPGGFKMSKQNCFKILQAIGGFRLTNLRRFTWA